MQRRSVDGATECRGRRARPAGIFQRPQRGESGNQRGDLRTGHGPGADRGARKVFIPRWERRGAGRSVLFRRRCAATGEGCTVELADHGSGGRSESAGRNAARGCRARKQSGVWEKLPDRSDAGARNGHDGGAATDRRGAGTDTGRAEPRAEAGGNARSAGRATGGNFAKPPRQVQPEGRDANVQSDAGALDPVDGSGRKRPGKFTNGNASSRARRTGDVATVESREAADAARQCAAANAGCKAGDIAELKDECFADDVSRRTRGASEPPAARRNTRTWYERMGRCDGSAFETGSRQAGDGLWRI